MHFFIIQCLERVYLVYYSCEKSSILFFFSFFFFFGETFSFFFLPFFNATTRNASIRERKDRWVRCSGGFLFHGDSRDSVAERRMLLLSVKEEATRNSFEELLDFVGWIFEKEKNSSLRCVTCSRPICRNNPRFVDSLSSLRSDLRKVRPMRGQARCARGERNTGWIHGTRTSVDTVGSSRTPEKFDRF